MLLLLDLWLSTAQVRDSKSLPTCLHNLYSEGAWFQEPNEAHFISSQAHLCFHQQLHDNQERIVYPSCPQTGGQRFGKTVQPPRHASSLSGLWQQSFLWILASSLPPLRYVPEKQPQCFSKKPVRYCSLSQRSVPFPLPLFSLYYSRVRCQQPQQSLLGQTSARLLTCLNVKLILCIIKLHLFKTLHVLIIPGSSSS